MRNSATRDSTPSKLPFLIVLVILIAIAAFLVNYHEKPTRAQLAQQISLGSTASSQMFVVGTLASLGSFEYQTSPLLSELAVKRRLAAHALLNRQISVDQAVAVQTDADHARRLIDGATRACDPAPHTGRCRASRSEVAPLLEQAKRAVAAIPAYVSAGK